MKKYVTPELEMVILDTEDVLTNSPASVLFEGENEITKQWWVSGSQF